MPIESGELRYTRDDFQIRNYENSKERSSIESKPLMQTYRSVENERKLKKMFRKKLSKFRKKSPKNINLPTPKRAELAKTPFDVKYPELFSPKWLKEQKTRFSKTPEASRPSKIDTIWTSFYK